MLSGYFKGSGIVFNSTKIAKISDTLIDMVPREPGSHLARDEEWDGWGREVKRKGRGKWKDEVGHSLYWTGGGKSEEGNRSESDPPPLLLLQGRGVGVRIDAGADQKKGLNREVIVVSRLRLNHR